MYFRVKILFLPWSIISQAPLPLCYVDDPRNTDNAWMETCCTLFHDRTGDLTRNIKLEAGDDANAVKWMEIDLESEDFKLYASHRSFVMMARNYIEQHYC